MFFGNASAKRRAKQMLLATSVLHGLFPIIIHVGSERMPPLFFGGVSLLLAAVVTGIFLPQRFTRLGNVLLRPHVLRDVLLVALCNLIIPIILISEGTRMTTGINTALLLQAEMLFTFLFCVVLFGQRMRLVRLLGAACVFSGTVFILFTGPAAWNTGNILIILATVLYPFGNLVSKRLLLLMHAREIIFARSLVSGSILLLLSAVLEWPRQLSVDWWQASWLIGVQGVLVFCLAKYLWYEGLKAVSVARAVFLVSSSPAFSMFFAIAILGEIPSGAQTAGFVLTMAGVVLLTVHITKKSPPHSAVPPAL